MTAFAWVYANAANRRLARDTLRRWQHGRCGICGWETDRLHLDHDHGTGLVRGLLCSGCNTQLGVYELRRRARRVEPHWERYLTTTPAASYAEHLRQEDVDTARADDLVERLAALVAGMTPERRAATTGR